MLRRFLFVIGLLAFTSLASAQAPTEFKGHTGLIYSVAYSPDGKTLATASFDKTVKLWDAATGKELHTLKGHDNQVYGVAFSPDGKLLATSSQDKTIRLWNPKDGKFIRELKGHTDIVDTIAFSPDSKLLASGSVDKSVKLWNPEDGKEVKVLGTHKESVYCVAFSPNGQFLASSSNDATIKIFDVKGQKEIKILGAAETKPAPAKKDDKKDPKDKKDDKKDPKDKKDDKKDPKDKKEVTTPKDVIEGITTIVWLPDNNTLLAGGYDKHVRVWNVSEGKQIKKLEKTPDDIFALAVSRDGKKIASVGYGGSLRLWDPTKEKATWTHQLADEAKKTSITYCVAFTPDGNALVTGHERGNIVRVTPLKQ